MTVRVLSEKINSDYEAVTRACYDSAMKRLSTVNEALLNQAGAHRDASSTWVWRDGSPACAAEAAERLNHARGTDLSIRSLINGHRAAQVRLTELAPKL